MNRRSFLRAAAGVAAAFGLGPLAQKAEVPESCFSEYPRLAGGFWVDVLIPVQTGPSSWELMPRKVWVPVQLLPRKGELLRLDVSADTSAVERSLRDICSKLEELNRATKAL